MKSHRTSTGSSGPAAPAVASPDAAPQSNQAAQDALAAAQVSDEQDESWLHKAGEGLGLGAGVLVTELLALVPGWNDDLLDENGAPVASVEGAERVGDHNLEGRHKQVVGPQIATYADGLDDGWWKDFVSGVGEGATDAPGASYRLEAAVMDHFDGD